MRSTTSFALAFAATAAAREVPANLKAFYEANLHGSCANPISQGYSNGHGSTDTVYCQDPSSGAIFLKTPGAYTDVDIDCDGAGAGTGDCSNDQTGQSITAWADNVKQLSNGAIDDLNTHHHTYVVFGNDSPKFDATEHGIEPLSVMAAVCGDKVIMGVYGDVNADNLVGEASISLAKLCFPDEHITGDSGHSENDVLFIAFPGKDAVPRDAKWDATDPAGFEKSLWATGDRLLETLGGGKRNGTGSVPPSKTTSAEPSPDPTPTETVEESGDWDEAEWEKRALVYSRLFRGRKI